MTGKETTAYEWKRSTSAVDVRRSKTFLLKLPTSFQKPRLQGFSHRNFSRGKSLEMRLLVQLLCHKYNRKDCLFLNNFFTIWPFLDYSVVCSKTKAQFTRRKGNPGARVTLAIGIPYLPCKCFTTDNSSTRDNFPPSCVTSIKS